MTRHYLRAIALAALFLAVGCASNSDSTAPAQTPSTAGPANAQQPQHAECVVCKKNADLACVDVTVDSQTPKYAYQGKTYYFCSDECRDKFAKNPTQYLPK